MCVYDSKMIPNNILIFLMRPVELFFMLGSSQYKCFIGQLFHISTKLTRNPYNLALYDLWNCI